MTAAGPARNYVELADGSRRRLRDLVAEVPHTFFMDAVHVEVCERLAGRAELSPELHATYVNLLFGKSRRTRQVTALIELTRRGRIRPRRVVSDLVGAEFADLLGNGVTVELSEPRARNLIDRGHGLRFACKVLAHRGFRLLGRLPANCPVVVRAWVDTTERTYPTHLDSAALLVYPFAGSAARQVKYIWRCRRMRRRYALVGVPFRFSDVLRVLLGGRDRDRVIAERETRAFRRHAEELLARGVRQVYTTDEFSAASHVLHAVLLAKGVHSTNTAHGVAVYGPYVCYSHFRYFTRRQRDHYSARGRIETHDYVARNIDGGVRPTDDHYRPTIVFVQGNWQASGKTHEARFEEAGLRRVVEVCRELGLPLSVRPHPNMGRLTRRRTARRFGVLMVEAPAASAGGHPIFINTLSSYYYDCLNRGPTVFLKNETQQPQDLFGEGIHAIELDDVERELRSFREHAHWRERFAAQLARERHTQNEQALACTQETAAVEQ